MRSWVVFGVIAVVAAACGGDDSDTAASSSATRAGGLVAGEAGTGTPSGPQWSMVAPF